MGCMICLLRWNSEMKLELQELCMEQAGSSSDLAKLFRELTMEKEKKE